LSPLAWLKLKSESLDQVIVSAALTERVGSSILVTKEIMIRQVKARDRRRLLLCVGSIRRSDLIGLKWLVFLSEVLLK
jgi:hypothetical protein